MSEVALAFTKSTYVKVDHSEAVWLECPECHCPAKRNSWGDWSRHRDTVSGPYAYCWGPHENTENIVSNTATRTTQGDYRR